TALLHQVNVATLRLVFYALKRKAAPGVDGVTWQDYEAELEPRLEDRFAFSLASALRSTASAAGRPALFGGFVATMAESDFSCPCIIGFGSSPSRCGPVGSAACGRT